VLGKKERSAVPIIKKLVQRKRGREIRGDVAGSRGEGGGNSVKWGPVWRREKKKQRQCLFVAGERRKGREKRGGDHSVMLRVPQGERGEKKKILKVCPGVKRKKGGPAPTIKNVSTK